MGARFRAAELVDILLYAVMIHHVSGSIFQIQTWVAAVYVRPTNSYIVCTYKAGYTASAFETYPILPTDLLNAIKDQVSFLYENRGEGVDVSSVCDKAWRTTLRYSRNPFFV